ncbi:MAG: hypothetical protein AAB316_21105, partial [Bacteroidota bacterium]
MRHLTILLFLFLLLATAFAQNPHGTSLKIDCAACHSPDGWKITAETWQQPVPPTSTASQRFTHDQTDFPLTGKHASVDCRDCHQSLVFEEAQPDCISCHTDLHQMTVGKDCARCHSTSHWLVDNISELHFDNGFPLLGNHAVADCRDCHVSETALRFNRIGNDCLNCHLDEFQATAAPDHEAAGYSMDCTICHDFASPSWQWTGGAGNHGFFPLTKGHQIEDCNRCHIGGDFTNTPTDCFACHQDDFQATTSPDHEAGNFPTDCSICHTTDPGWQATDFKQHDQLYFPIFSGKHNGEWNECTDCHTTPGDFKAFSCIDCHEHDDPGDLANEHDE